ncbi:DUF4240 domain-containing protein [Kitasatospora sp. NPDC059795]|uniref:DUF4240 domain-containing protein n=1 Tax=Kitasatospora sp. NPDC059795 TaxID=3346949 RepID=UPI0036468571
MDNQQFWQLIDQARAQAPDPDGGNDDGNGDGNAVAERAVALLALRPAAEIVAAQEALDRLMADSYLAPLWAAAYLINGGCSDDGFDYFRGWLITQGRETFERALADPDTLAALPSVRACARDGLDIECGDVLSLAWTAHRAATSTELPQSSGPTPPWPSLDPDWDFDLDDSAELARRLPRLSALYPA